MRSLWQRPPRVATRVTGIWTVVLPSQLMNLGSRYINTREITSFDILDHRQCLLVKQNWVKNMEHLVWKSKKLIWYLCCFFYVILIYGWPTLSLSLLPIYSSHSGTLPNIEFHYPFPNWDTSAKQLVLQGKWRLKSNKWLPIQIGCKLWVFIVTTSGIVRPQ